MHDVDRFSRWAPTYDRHFLQRLVFTPVQDTVLALAAEQVPEPKTILDVGCGTGRLLRAAQARFPGAALTGVDPAPGMIDVARASVGPAGTTAFRLGTAERLPFQEERFDLVFSTMTFHHWVDQRQAITEVARVLAPAGRWVLADFIPTGLMRYVTRVLHIGHFPERRRLDAMLEEAGLSVAAGRRVQRGISVLAIGSR